MAAASKIEWTDATWNPVVGCSIVSPGCTNCYAMKMAARIEKMAETRRPGGTLGPMTHYAGTTRSVNGNAVWTGKVAMAPGRILLEPLRRKKPTTYFVNSMGDLFHESVPDEWIDKVFAVIALCPQHTFQVLTKRAERMREYLTSARRDEWSRIADPLGNWAPLSPQEYTDRAHIFESVPDKRCGIWISVFSRWPLPNVWLGVSAERQKEADERIPHLLQTPAAVRFISAEPLLGPIDLTNVVLQRKSEHFRYNALTGRLRGAAGWPHDPEFTGRAPAVGRLHWVIVGGESGKDARPMHPQWARDLRDQCNAGIPFFFKQWGSWKDGSDFAPDAHVVMNDGRICEFESAELVDMDRAKPVPPCNPTLMRRVGKKAAGRLLDSVEHNDMPRRRA